MNKSTISFLDNQLKNYVISHDAMKTLTGGGGGTNGSEEEEEETPPWMMATADNSGVAPSDND
ncbi:MAG: hypothetical protein WBB45_16695 [Cyclobacteriaceae bacterium]